MAANTTMPLRIAKRSLLNTRWALPPRRSITTVQHTLTTSSNPIPEPLLRSRAHPIPERDLPTTQKPQQLPSTRPKRLQHRKGPPAPLEAGGIYARPRQAPTQPAYTHAESALDPSVRRLLPLLKAQGSHYLRVHIHGKPYLVTPGDTIRLPFLMHGVTPGDVLRLNRATLLGSRDYTLKAGAESLLPSRSTVAAEEENDGRKAKELGFIDERLFTCRARVMGTEMEPMRFKEKTKRRQRHIRTIKSKQAFTVLRVMEIGVSDADALPEAVKPSGVVEEQSAEDALAGNLAEVRI